MIRQLLLGAAALALAAPAVAQHAGHGAMTMPMPAKKKAPPKKPAAKKPVVKKAVARKPAARKPAAKSQPAVAPAPAVATPAPPPPPPVAAVPDHGAMDHSAHQPAPAAPAAPATPAVSAAMDHAGHSAMTGALGPYPMAREASGTAWQPDVAEHGGVMAQAGGWRLMAHATANLVYSHQSGPRGADKTFVSGMLMGSAAVSSGRGRCSSRAWSAPTR